jgi:glycosyltransferase involved in cell wall biosynthesis
MNTTENTDISIVMGTFNRSEMLRSALESLIHQETDQAFTYDIIVVDDGSTDDTPATVARAAEDSPVPVRYFRESGKGVASARNRGIRESSGTWIAFFDDDQIAEPDWLKEHLALAEKTGAPCVGGAVRLLLDPEVHRSLSPLFHSLLGETVGRNTVARCDFHHTLGTGNLMLKRSLLDRTGLFDASLREGGCDLDLFRRLLESGNEAWYSPAAVVNHIIPEYRLTEGYLVWKSKVYGQNFAVRDYRQYGLPINVLACLARVGQALLINAPALLWAGITGNRVEKIGRKCLLHRSSIYARQTLRHISPRIFSQKVFFKGYEFRSERNLFGKDQKAGA